MFDNKAVVRHSHSLISVNIYKVLNIITHAMIFFQATPSVVQMRAKINWKEGEVQTKLRDQNGFTNGMKLTQLVLMNRTSHQASSMSGYQVFLHLECSVDKSANNSNHA